MRNNEEQEMRKKMWEKSGALNLKKQTMEGTKGRKFNFK